LQQVVSSGYTLIQTQGYACAPRRVLIFIDELPWLDTARSRFMKAFELFWNEWASKQDNLKLVVCGSAATNDHS